MSSNQWLARYWLSFIHPAALRAVMETEGAAIVARRCRCTARYVTYSAATTIPVGAMVALSRAEIMQAVGDGDLTPDVRDTLARMAGQRAERALP